MVWIHREEEASTVTIKDGITRDDITIMYHIIKKIMVILIHALTDVRIIMIEIEGMHITIILIIDTITEIMKEHLVMADQDYKIIIKILVEMKVVTLCEKTVQKSEQINLEQP